MVKDYLQKVYEKNIEKKIRMEKKRDKYKARIVEKENFIILLERAVDTNTEIFTPLDINRDLYEKIDKLKIEIAELDATYQELNEDIQEIDLEIVEVRDVIRTLNRSNYDNILDIMLSYNHLKSEKLFLDYKKVDLDTIKMDLKSSSYELFNKTAQLERIFVQEYPFDGNKNMIQIIDELFYDYLINKHSKFSYSIDGSCHTITDKFGLLFINIIRMLCDLVFENNPNNNIRLELELFEKEIITKMYFKDVIHLTNNNNTFKVLDDLVTLFSGEIQINNNSFVMNIPIHQ